MSPTPLASAASSRPRPCLLPILLVLGLPCRQEARPSQARDPLRRPPRPSPPPCSSSLFLSFCFLPHVISLSFLTPRDSHGHPELRPMLLLVSRRQIRSEWVTTDRIHSHMVSSFALHHLKPAAAIASMSRASSLRLARQPLRWPCPASSSESVRSVRIRSTMLARLLHGFVLLPRRILGKMIICLDTITIIAMLVVSFLSLCLASYHFYVKHPKLP